MGIILSIKRIFKDIYIWVTIILVSVLAFGNSLTNLIEYKGVDQLELINPVDLVICSAASGTWGTWLITLFPILVPFAAAMLYSDDKNSGIVYYKASRKGFFNYGLSNFWAIGISTAIAFVVPMLMDCIIMYASFSGFNSGMELASSIYDISTIDYMKQFWLYELYYQKSLLYSLVTILLIGILAGVFAQFTYMLTTIFYVPIKVFYLIPAFLILEICSLISQKFLKDKIDLDYFHLFLTPELHAKTIFCLFGLCFLIFIISLLAVCKRFKGDCIV